jgi:hypothetical protein
MVDFLDEAPHAFQNSVAPLREEGDRHTGRDEDHCDHAKYVLPAHRHVVAFIGSCLRSGWSSPAGRAQ